MKKIAITGIDGETRILLTHALSYITGYGIVRQTAFSSQAITYGLCKDLVNCSWHELFIYTLSSFSERIEIEQNYGKYISNGSAFSEYAYMEAFCKSSRLMSKERTFMLSGVRKIILEYAVREYDCVVHIENTENSFTPGVFSNEHEECLRSLVELCKIKFLIQKESILTDLLEMISTEIKVRPVLPIEIALRKAEQELFNSKAVLL